jgi:hypothetical protein
MHSYQNLASLYMVFYSYRRSHKRTSVLCQASKTIDLASIVAASKIPVEQMIDPELQKKVNSLTGVETIVLVPDTSTKDTPDWVAKTKNLATVYDYRMSQLRVNSSVDDSVVDLIIKETSFDLTSGQDEAQYKKLKLRNKHTSEILDKFGPDAKACWKACSIILNTIDTRKSLIDSGVAAADVPAITTAIQEYKNGVAYVSRITSSKDYILTNTNAVKASHLKTLNEFKRSMNPIAQILSMTISDVGGVDTAQTIIDSVISPSFASKVELANKLELKKNEAIAAYLADKTNFDVKKYVSL